MEGESGATRSINYELHSLDIQADEMERKNRFTKSIVDELDSSDIH